MRRIIQAAAVLALLPLSACGGAESNPDQPSADERKSLDDIARKQDEEQKDQTFDTSADSLVINEGAVAETENGSAAADGEAAQAEGNQAATQ